MGLLSTIGAASGRAFGLTRVGAAIRDAYFNLTTLLLPGDGTNGAQNNTFLDSSTNNFTITRNGNTTQGTFSPFSQTGWSNYFLNTGSQNLSAVTGADTSPGTGDFCAELWYWSTTTSGNYGLFGNIESNTDTQWGILLIQGSSLVRFQGWNTTFVSGTEPARNAWNHVAVCRSGTTMSMFINGTRAGTATVSNNFSATTNIRVGGPNGVDYFLGYISNARFVKGSSVYDPSQTSITVPTSPLTAITNTKFLTCQNNRFVDNSSTGYAITPNGTPSVQAFSPFAPTAAYSAATVGGSGYFDGTGDYLTVADNSALEPVGNNFCIEFSYYPTSVSGTKTLIGKRANPSTDYGFLILADGANARVYISSANTSYDIVNGTIIGTLVTNQWNHIAVYRISNAWYASFNGSITTLNASNSSSVNNNAGAWGIGADSNGAAPIQGYMANTRFVIGSSVYTSTNAPFPTAPLTAITNTQLLLNFTNSGITDATAKNDLETVGNAQISTTQSKFGGSSMYFDGTGDYLLIPSSPNFALNGDATVEFWLRVPSLPSTYSNLFTINAAASLFIYLNSAGNIGIQTGSAYRDTTTAPISTNTWYHVAITKTSGNTWTVYVNGTSQASSGTGTMGSAISAAIVGIGATSAGANTLNGFIDDLRVSQFARYTSNFTAPTSAFALQ